MLKEFDQDTIAAISTPMGEGGLGVIRLSGKDAIAIADKIFESKKKMPVSDQKAFTVQYGHVVASQDSKPSRVIDEVLILVMRAPRSYTCEDVVEISAHGGPAVLEAILREALKAGARPASKGEFTKRAFLNGRLDLLQAEAVLDLVKAKTQGPRQWAVDQLEGFFSKKMKEIKAELLDILTHLEASIDFPEDFPQTDSLSKIAARLGVLSENLRRLLETAGAGFLAKQGLGVVIAGRPNVGKSSLMNALAKFNRVIVTPHPGTTRDVVEEEIEIGGFPVRISDTAGIRSTDHPIEKEGIERSKLAVADADLILYVVDWSRPWHPEDEDLIRGLGDRKTIVVLNKTDLPPKIQTEVLTKILGNAVFVKASCVSDGGVETLEKAIFNFISGGSLTGAGEAVVSSVRQKDLLEKTLESIQRARTACQESLSPELVAVDVRLGLDCLGMLVGEVVTDDVLEALFNQFCIGK
jgi:tRNA modification GTPase